MARLTAGFMCAPLAGPKTSMRKYSAKMVAKVLPRSATATLPPASRSAMTPEPRIAANNRAVARNSAKQART
jgi:hypothetical protein